MPLLTWSHARLRSHGQPLLSALPTMCLIVRGLHKLAILYLSVKNVVTQLQPKRHWITLTQHLEIHSDYRTWPLGMHVALPFSAIQIWSQFPEDLRSKGFTRLLIVWFWRDVALHVRNEWRKESLALESRIQFNDKHIFHLEADQHVFWDHQFLIFSPPESGLTHHQLDDSIRISPFQTSVKFLPASLSLCTHFQYGFSFLFFPFLLLLIPDFLRSAVPCLGCGEATPTVLNGLEKLTPLNILNCHSTFLKCYCYIFLFV